LLSLRSEKNEAYVALQDTAVKNTDTLSSLFDESFEFAKGLKPKPTKNRK